MISLRFPVCAVRNLDSLGCLVTLNVPLAKTSSSFFVDRRRLVVVCQIIAKPRCLFLSRLAPRQDEISEVDCAYMNSPPPLMRQAAVALVLEYLQTCFFVSLVYCLGAGAEHCYSQDQDCLLMPLSVS